jgi:PAS domain-containing protein
VAGDPEQVSNLVEVPRQPDAPGQRSDAAWVVDVALGVVGASVGAGLAVVRTTTESPVLRTAAAWRPPFVPALLQPAMLLADLARRGARHRVWAGREVERLLDQWTPLLVELVVSRLDLTGIVTRHVDIDDVVKAVDLDAVVARIDLDAIVQRIDLDAAVGGVDLNAAVEGVDIDAIAGRLDIEAVIERIDVVAMVEEVIAAIDLPAIIRDSTGSMASETVRSARMTGISADEAISRGIERYLFRRRRSPTTTGAQ